MVFSSALFLLCFLPVTVLGYHLFRGLKARNLWLLGASLLFYSWGETFHILLLLFTIVVNWAFGLALAQRPSRWLLGLAVTANLALLVHFKYADFLVASLNQAIGVQLLALPEIHLPLGVSFFIFQAISYVVDVHRGQAEAQPRLAQVALYIALFPQLVAGPIVRYASVALQLNNRETDYRQIADGVRRFITGLAKKVLIANVLGQCADEIFALQSDSLSFSVAWLGVICYTLQIYFDFSGYSDMAIGLGQMFGFTFPENFRHPYIARSIREFWRRWHISLSSWFRDYLYIPLGGSHRGPFRTSLNLFAVFLLCGLWHGASWNFVLWGAFHGLFLSLERLLPEATLATGVAARVASKTIPHVYVLLVVMIGWVLFRADSLTQAGSFYHAMLGLNDAHGLASMLSQQLNPKILIALGLGILFSIPIGEALRPQLLHKRFGEPVKWVIDAGLICLLALSVVMIAAGTYNPFIYFRF